MNSGGGDSGAGGSGEGPANAVMPASDQNSRPPFNPLSPTPNLQQQHVGSSALASNLTSTSEASAEKSKSPEAKRLEESKAPELKLDCAYTVHQFFKDKKECVDPMGNGLVRKVIVPTRKGGKLTKLKLTDEASSVTTSLVHCVTRELAARRSRNGNLSLHEFVVVDGTVHAVVKPKNRLADSSAIQADGKALASCLKQNFEYEGLLPCYFKNLINLLENIPAGGLENWRWAAVDTNCGLMTPIARLLLPILLKVHTDGLNDQELTDFYAAIVQSLIKPTWFDDVTAIPELKKVESYEVNGVKTRYDKSDPKTAFTYIRNHATHIASHIKELGRSFDEDAELLIPEAFGDFLSEVMMYLLKGKLSNLVSRIAKTAMSCSSLPIDFKSNTTAILESLKLTELNPAAKENELPAELNKPPADAVLFGDMIAPSGSPVCI